MVEIQLLFNKKDLKDIQKMPDEFRIGLIKGLRMAMLYAEGKSKSGFASGTGPPLPPPGPLRVRTGHLRRSIESGVDGDVGYLETNVKYGARHELEVPMRPFLRPALEDNMDKIAKIITDNILKGLK